MPALAQTTLDPLRRRTLMSDPPSLIESVLFAMPAIIYIISPNKANFEAGHSIRRLALLRRPALKRSPASISGHRRRRILSSTIAMTSLSQTIVTPSPALP
jgi:hypothetical protein